MFDRERLSYTLSYNFIFLLVSQCEMAKSDFILPTVHLMYKFVTSVNSRAK